MSSILPPNKPALPADKVRAALAHALRTLPGADKINLDLLQRSCPVMVLANRAYFLDSMGAPGKNDWNQYDDGAWLVTPDKVIPFNWNCDPAAKGWNASLGKPFANLMPGVWPFVKGLHKGQYKAWRQPYDEQAKTLQLDHYFTDERGVGHFKVMRYENVNARGYVDDGYHAINGHRGGINGTSSWGCQTVPPEQYDGPNGYLELSYRATQAQPFLPYVLTEERLQ